MLFLNLFQHQGAKRDICNALPGVVFIKSNLVGLGAALFFSSENLADLNELLPMNDTALDRIEDIGLLVLNRLLDRNNAQYVTTRQSRIIDLPAFGFGKAAVDQTNVAADDGCHVHSRLEPVAVEDGNTR